MKAFMAFNLAGNRNNIRIRVTTSAFYHLLKLAAYFDGKLITIIQDANEYLDWSGRYR